MKKLILVASITSFMFSASIMAQTSVLNKVKDSKEVKQGETTVSTAKARAEKMAKDLKLTDAQKAQVTSVLTKQDASIAKLNSVEKAGSDAYKTKLAAIQKSTDSELQSIIGKDKFQQYQGTIKAGEQQVKDKASSKIKSFSSGLNIK